jgi:hypothetical protein
MFPSIPDELNDINENKIPKAINSLEIMSNLCSKGMFPEVPQ